jgi:hypothetical protein
VCNAKQDKNIDLLKEKRKKRIKNGSQQKQNHLLKQGTNKEHELRKRQSFIIGE